MSPYESAVSQLEHHIQHLVDKFIVDFKVMDFYSEDCVTKMLYNDFYKPTVNNVRKLIDSINELHVIKEAIKFLSDKERKKVENKEYYLRADVGVKAVKVRVIDRDTYQTVREFWI